MTNTVYGILFDRDGFASASGLVQGPGGPVLRRKHWATPAADVCAVQDGRIMVDRDHDHRPVGEIVHLERTRGGDMWAVAHVDDHVLPIAHVQVGGETIVLDHPLYWSAERIGGPDLGYLLTAASLTTTPARISAKPVEFLPGALDYRGRVDRWNLDTFRKEMLRRATDTHLDRRRRGDREEPLVVHSPIGDPVPALARDDRRAHGPLELRSAASYDVHVGRREVDVLVAPADSPTTINEPGRRYVETFAPGCFAGCETRPERVKVNLHHQRERLVGKAVKLDPWAKEGLVGTLKLARTKDADEALALIDDDLLGVSAGFTIDPDGVEWTRGRQHRRVRRASLRHIALVDDPAFDEARITAVRSHALH